MLTYAYIVAYILVSISAFCFCTRWYQIATGMLRGIYRVLSEITARYDTVPWRYSSSGFGITASIDLWPFIGAFDLVVVFLAYIGELLGTVRVPLK